MKPFVGETVQSGNTAATVGFGAEFISSLAIVSCG